MCCCSLAVVCCCSSVGVVVGGVPLLAARVYGVRCRLLVLYEVEPFVVVGRCYCLLLLVFVNSCRPCCCVLFADC